MDKFDFNKIDDFDEHINLSIPNYDWLIEQVVKMSDYFIDEKTKVFDLGCSTGKLFNMMELHDDIEYVGIDNSNLLPTESFDSRVSFLNDDLLTFEGIDNASLIFSIFTLQFLPRNKREMMIEKISNGLNRNGAFIMCEKTYSSNARLQDMTNSLYYEFKEQNFEVSEILKKERQLRRSLKLNTLDELVEELSRIGDVEIFWRSFNFVGLIAIKS